MERRAKDVIAGLGQRLRLGLEIAVDRGQLLIGEFKVLMGKCHGG